MIIIVNQLLRHWNLQAGNATMFQQVACGSLISLLFLPILSVMNRVCKLLIVPLVLLFVIACQEDEQPSPTVTPTIAAEPTVTVDATSYDSGRLPTHSSLSLRRH